MVESYFILPDEQGAPPEMQSKWLLRIVLGRRQLLDKGLSVTHVASKIKEMYGKDIAVIFSDDNADEQVVRIRMITRGGDKDDEDDFEEKKKADDDEKGESRRLNRGQSWTASFSYI